MNEIINKLLLVGHKLVPEMHLRDAGLTYSACRPCTKNKEKTQKFKRTGDSRFIYQNKLNKVCFEHDMAYGDCKDLPRRTAPDKVLRDKAFNIAKIQNMTDVKEVLLQWFLNFLLKSLLVVLLKAKLFRTNN